MHSDAQSRLRQLVNQALEAIIVTPENKMDLKSSYAAVNPLQQFLAKSLAKWIHDDYAFIYAYISIREILEKRGLLSTPGPLGLSTTPAQRDLAVDDIVRYWINVPQFYVFKFPLPSFFLLEADVPIAPGVKLTNTDRDNVDYKYSGRSPMLGNLMAATQQTQCVCLQVEANGLMCLGESIEIPAASAIRTTKIVLAMAKVLGVLFASTPAIDAPKYVSYTVSQGLGFESGRVALPGPFANSLKGCAVKMPTNPPTLANLAFVQPLDVRLSAVGCVVEGDAKFSEMKPPHKSNSAALSDYRLKQHCARIATAAEWMFDAETEAPSAMSFVQVAIAFEALYGGSKDDAIGKTLSNRVAYSLGRSPAAREDLISEFLEFYSTRSIVVHSGATRLSKQQRDQFTSAKEMLRRCLRHEMELINPVGALSLTSDTR